MFLMLYGYNDVAVTLPIWSNLDITLPFDVYINMINVYMRMLEDCLN